MKYCALGKVYKTAGTCQSTLLTLFLSLFLPPLRRRSFFRFLTAFLFLHRDRRGNNPTETKFVWSEELYSAEGKTRTRPRGA